MVVRFNATELTALDVDKSVGLSLSGFLESEVSAFIGSSLGFVRIGLGVKWLVDGWARVVVG